MQLEVTRLLHSRRDPAVVPVLTYFSHAQKLFELTESLNCDEIKRAHNGLFMYGLGTSMDQQAFSILLGWHGDDEDLKWKSKLRRMWEKNIKAHKKGERVEGLNLLNLDSKV